jgi:3-deoxy-7-phosphoheptulonate synthase
MSLSQPYKLAGWKGTSGRSVIQVGSVEIGAADPVIITDLPILQSDEPLLKIADFVSRSGIRLIRGNFFKLGQSGATLRDPEENELKSLSDLKRAFDLRIVTEVLSVEGVELGERYADVLQVGAQNMQNFSLLRQVGRTSKPIILKRAPSAKLDEWLLAAEYILLEGNPNIILCECGVRAFHDYSDYKLDLMAIPTLQTLTPLPVIVDLEKCADDARALLPMGRASVASGAAGIIAGIPAAHGGRRSIEDLESGFALFARMIGEVQKTASIARSRWPEAMAHSAD